MRGRSWIWKLRVTDAQRVREEIARLEEELLGLPDAHKRAKFIGVGYQLQASKSRLQKLERCIAALEPIQAQQDRNISG